MTAAFPTPIRRGYVYWVPDEQVALPPENHRTSHSRRPVIVLTGDHKNDDGHWPVVTVCPVSSGAQNSEYDIRIPANTGGLPSKGWARVCLVQPMDKHFIGERIGQLDAKLVDQIMANYLGYLGAY
ncbi:type II toxin-antitoxin system PemK/MazF family toxin [Paenarthrobacter sp.]|uniref:type II toxin-antitoxin system PemK/MazF family toxin n=1 Tax=Paenarthrobacter sp. TaxID=1931993 RepID=UPI0035C70184